jgi:arginine repressor
MVPVAEELIKNIEAEKKEITQSQLARDEVELKFLRAIQGLIGYGKVFFKLWEKIKEGKIDASTIPSYENILESERKKIIEIEGKNIEKRNQPLKLRLRELIYKVWKKLP